MIFGYVSVVLNLSVEATSQKLEKCHLTCSKGEQPRVLSIGEIGEMYDGIVSHARCHTVGDGRLSFYQA